MVTFLDIGQIKHDLKMLFEQDHELEVILDRNAKILTLVFFTDMKGITIREANGREVVLNEAMQAGFYVVWLRTEDPRFEACRNDGF